MDGEHLSVRHGHRDRGEILYWVKRQLLVDRWIHREGRVDRGQERIAVGWRFRDQLGGEVAARAGPVFDHERLLELGCDFLEDDAREGIERPRDRADDHADRLRRILLRRGWQPGNSGGKNGEETGQLLHTDSSW